jgi:predicted phage terminase large subunit-like protein
MPEFVSRSRPGRVYRVMRAHGLLLQRHSGAGVERRHDGRVAVDQSDTRWSSNGFEIGCDNGKRVRIAFTLDCCDREAISWVATTGSIDSNDIRDLMVERTTPIESPQSNGMAEAFVKTFKRDYAHVHSRTNAATALRPSIAGSHAGHRRLPVESTVESGEKSTRAMPLASQVNVGNVSLVRSSWADSYRDELRGFPGMKHDAKLTRRRALFSMLVPFGPTRAMRINWMGR